jgi:hypothetical protein
MSAMSIPLRRGDSVQVRSPAEILATLDERGELEHMPFMPEMARLCGHRFNVTRRAEKVCDTIQKQGSLRLSDTVLLDDLRCDGEAHGGCQAECRYYWKEAWLTKIEPGQSISTTDVGPNDLQRLLDRVSQDLCSQVVRDGKAVEIWRCQSTQLLQAMQRRLRIFDPEPYVREYTCGNVTFGQFLRITARAAVEESAIKVGLIKAGPPLAGQAQPVAAEAPLNLQPGELVQVKSREEIAATLDARGTNRGLWFDREMAYFCGGTYRVRRRVTHFIDEADGRMVRLKTDAVMLDDVYCGGNLSPGRWFCPRGIYPYWREIWLRRLDRKA